MRRILRAGIILCLTLPSAVTAQTVRGRVQDEVTRRPVPFATIRVLRDTAHVLSTRLADSTGQFLLLLPRDDTVIITFESVGYNKVTSQRFTLGRGDDVTLEVHMSAQPMLVDPVVVTARHTVPLHLQEFYRRAEFNRKVGRGKIWLREDLEKEHMSSVRPLLSSVLRRPVASCSGTKVLVDNLPVFDSDLDMISTDDLEGIEIYRDPVEMPDEYHGLCAVALLWRKPYGEGGKPLSWRRILMLVSIVAVVFVVAR